MRREAKLLLRKGCDSIVLSIELFNRPHDRGRVTGALILMDHSFEMLMKASIVQRGGEIRDKGRRETIGFDACVRRSLTDGRIKYMTESEAIVLRSVNILRDAAQHYLLDISEGQLYVHMQSGVSAFRDVAKRVFDQDLADQLPHRVLPVSTSPPTDIATLFELELEEVRKLLQPGRRRRIEAASRMRPLAILDRAVRGEGGQPSEQELRRIADRVVAGASWDHVFEGAARVEIGSEGDAKRISLRLTKTEGLPMHTVPEGTPGASVVVEKHVNELDRYSLGARQLARHVGLTVPKTVAVVAHIDLQSRAECFREFRVGKTVHKRYSQKAIDAIRATLDREDIEEIWRRHDTSSKKRR